MEFKTYFLLLCFLPSVIASSAKFSKANYRAKSWTGADDFPFRNISLPWDVRVDDLVSRLNLTELMLEMAMGGAGPAAGPVPAIDRGGLGLGPFQWLTECNRGDAMAGEATSFPQNIGLGASFWPKLVFDVGKATGAEIRAKYNDNRKKGNYGDHTGIHCYGPMVNMMRHPLWGRNQETYGEGPYLVGQFVNSYIRGIQGDQRYVQAAVGCKHIGAYSGPENIPESRLTFNAVVDERDLQLTYLPMFRECIRGGAYSIMCSLNSVNGIPACTSKMLLTDVLRTQMNFTGFVVTDEGALMLIITKHHYFNTTLQTAIGTIKAGVNLLDSGDDPEVFMQIAKAVSLGNLTEDLIRKRTKPLIYTRMRLGDFDPPEKVPFNSYNLSLVQSPEHQELSIKAAMKTFVLLKNQKQFLPIKKHFNKIAVVGPMADNVGQLYGDYTADPDPQFAKTPFQGLAPMANFVSYAAGCPTNHCGKYNQSAIQAAVKGTELVVVCLGTGSQVEAESNDRTSMDLQGYQEQLLADVVQAAVGTPVVLLLFTGGPVNLTFTDRPDLYPRIEAIMQCFLPAQATGQALYNVLTLSSPDANPAGRLPYTWYRTKDQVPSMTNYSMFGKTYRYFEEEPLYPFGYGLSYTSFEYLKADVASATIQAGTEQTVTGEMKNTGALDGDEVVQVYICWLDTTEAMPQRQLVAFDRFFVPKGKAKNFKFVIKAEQMAVWTDTKGFVVQPGRVSVFVGGQQPNQKKSVGSNVIATGFTIKGTKVLGRF